MKKINFILLGFLFIIASCDVLDLEPQHSVLSDNAIRNKSDLEKAITGCYDAFQSAGYYGRNYIVAADLATTNLNWTGTTAGYNQIDNNSILADNIIVEDIWSSIYTVLNRVNLVIERIPEVEGLEPADREEYLAEMYFLRALAHYDLYRYFGAIPLRTASSRFDEASLNIARSSVENVFASIMGDIEQAELSITDKMVQGKASYASVLALKSRVYLHYYYLTGNESNLDKVIDATTKVIEDFGLSLVENYADLFNESGARESIFEIDFIEQDRNRIAEYFFPVSLSGRYEFSPDTNFVDIFSSNDTRLDASVDTSGDIYVIKYKRIETGSDNVYVFRLAEMYLNRAEAYIMKKTNVTQIQQDLNVIIDRAYGDNAYSVTAADYTALAEILEEQRMKEFAFEGHRWFDLVRTGRALDVLEGVTDSNQTLFPIPLNEILANESINQEDQNPGY